MEYIQEILSSSIGAVGLPADQAYLYYGVLLVAVVLVLLLIAYYTLKRVIINFALGYVTMYIIKMFLGPHSVDDGTIMYVLMALFGPVAVIADALWHYFM